MRRLVLLLNLVLVSSRAGAQNFPPPVQTQVNLTNGTCTTEGVTSSGCVTLTTAGYSSVAIQVTGTWSGTLTFKGSADRLTFTALQTTQCTPSAATTTSNGLWTCAVAGYAMTEVFFTTYTSGTAVVTIAAAAAGGGSGGGGGGGGGAVTVADGADVALGATTDAAVSTDANGTVNAHLRGLDKLLAPITFSGGNLQVGVNVALPTGANTIGAVTQASGPWTTNQTQLNSVALGSPSNYGTSPGAVSVAGVNAFITNTPSVSQSGAPWADNITQFGSNPVVTGTGASGVGIPRVTVSTDSSITANQGTAAALSSAWPVRETDGTFQTQFDSAGSIKVTCPNCAPTTITVNGNGGLKQAVLGLRLLGALNEPLGDAVPLKVVNQMPVDPCIDPTRATSTNISQTGSTQVLTGQAGKRIVLCHYTVVGGDAENLSWVEGTGSTCGTGTLAVVGGTTAAAGMNFAANGGANAGSGDAWFAITSVPGDNICLLQSGTGRVAGSLKYAYLFQ